VLIRFVDIGEIVDHHCLDMFVNSSSDIMSIDEISLSWHQTAINPQILRFSSFTNTRLP